MYLNIKWLRVAPFAGAWIEITKKYFYMEVVIVAPFAGAWIEMLKDGGNGNGKGSLPSRERGLKSGMEVLFRCISFCRSLRGSVD